MWPTRSQRDFDKQAMRSLLFVPANSERMIGKALASDADGLILDLEDSVAPSDKENARQNTAQAQRLRVGVRVNADSPWYLEDLNPIGAAKPSFVMLPKCTGVGDVAHLGHQLDLLETQAGNAPGSIEILPLVTESAAAALRCDFSGASPRLNGLCFAAEDLSTDLGIAPRSLDGELRPPLALARATVLLAARAAGVAAFDTPYPLPADLEGLRGRPTLYADARGSGGHCGYELLERIHNRVAGLGIGGAWRLTLELVIPNRPPALICLAARVGYEDAFDMRHLYGVAAPGLDSVNGSRECLLQALVVLTHLARVVLGSERRARTVPPQCLDYVAHRLVDPLCRGVAGLRARMVLEKVPKRGLRSRLLLSPHPGAGGDFLGKYREGGQQIGYGWH